MTDDDGGLLRVEGVTKSWRRLPAPVLDDVSFSVGHGDSAWVTGGNGAGKTTLMRILSGLILPERGAIALGELGPERGRREYQRRIGMLAAGDRGLYARISVRRHLELWSGVAFVPWRERSARIARASADFALGGILDVRTDRLSMGQRQRVRLAMTFLHDPTLVLLDEPLNSLDEDGVDLLRTAIDVVLSRGGACLWFSPGNDGPGIEFGQRLRLDGGNLQAR